MELCVDQGLLRLPPRVRGRPAAGTLHEPKPFDTRKLGEDEKFQRPNNMKGPLGLWITAADYRDLAMVKRTWRGRWKSRGRGLAGLLQRRAPSAHGDRWPGSGRPAADGAQGRRRPAVAAHPHDRARRRGRARGRHRGRRARASPSRIRGRHGRPARVRRLRPHARACARTTCPRARVPTAASAPGRTPATASSPARSSAPRSTSWTTPGGCRASRHPAGADDPARLGAGDPRPGDRRRPTASASPTSPRRTSTSCTTSSRASTSRPGS